MGIAPVPTSPKFGLTDPSNGDGVCMGDDAFAFGKTDGMAERDQRQLHGRRHRSRHRSGVVRIRSKWDLYAAPPGAAHPVRPGHAAGRVYQHGGEPPEQPQSRYDIGVWIESDPNNPVVQFTQGSSTAVTGSCTHYNLTNGSTGVSNLDADACGDMSQGSGLAQLDLDILEVPCQDDDGDGVVEIGACIAWQNVVGDASRVCPTPGNETSYRHGTTPNNKAKCNCDPMVLPIDIAASLDIEKQSIGGTGEFDDTVFGAPLVAFTRNTATQGNPTVTNPVIIGAATMATSTSPRRRRRASRSTNITCTANGAVITIGTGQGGGVRSGCHGGLRPG